MRPYHSALREALLVTLAALCVSALSACGRREPPMPVRAAPGHPGRYELRFEAMGTDGAILVAADDLPQARRMMGDALPAIRSVETRMSTYRPDSEISRLNREGAQHGVELSEGALRVLREAVRYSRVTGGAFDVTYAPLRAVWREAQHRGEPPTQQEIDSARARIGSDKLVLSDRSARFAVEGMEVDLGGIAKGYAIELAAEALTRAGADSALVDLGGDMRVIGLREDGQKWRVRVRDPRFGDHPPIHLRLADAAVATSGDYARYFRIGDERYSHIIDPRTGTPVRDVPSATVVAPDATAADALATSVSVMDTDAALELIESIAGAECMIMTRAAEKVTLHQSKGFRALIEQEPPAAGGDR